MRHLLSLALPALSSLALAGCSITGGGSSPQTDVYDELASGMASDAVGSNGSSVATGSADVTMTRSGSAIEVAVDGDVYTMPATSQSSFTNSEWVNERQYVDYRFAGSGSSASLIAGRYMAITGFESGTTGNVYLMHGGVETSTSGLPNQSAIYEGAWEIAHNSGATNDAGVFAADADFDASRIDFAIGDQNSSVVGSGTGTISGNSFNSSFDVNTTGTGVSTASNNDVDGNFYGPSAEEMAGIIVGNDALGAGDDTYGVLYGHQR